MRIRSYKPGKRGKGLIQSEAAPQAMIWRIQGGWNGDPHHADVSKTLKVHRPNIAFHIDKQRRFYFHSEDKGFVHPSDPAKLAREVRGQYPKLTWGRISAEEYERRDGIREGKRTLAMNSRQLRPFEQGAHLHVLDWAHQTARYRFQAAGEAQVKAAARAAVRASPDASGLLELPSLEAAITGELRKLYALGHATVRSELDHQATGDALPVGLSAAPKPPSLRMAKRRKGRFPHCATCKMFDHGTCWGYGNYPVKPNEVCDSFERDGQVKTLAVSDAVRDPGRLRARAKLVAQAVAHEIWQAVHRGRLQGITDKRALRQVATHAGTGALSVAASHHAGGAINAGRRAAAESRRTEIVGARYTSVLDKNTCGECEDADTGRLLALDSPEWIPTPNPACLGGDRCRCIHVYQMATEVNAQPEAIAASQ